MAARLLAMVTVLGLAIDGAVQVDAIGNTWKPDVQGADNLGKYSSLAIVNGPVPIVSGNNFAIANDQSALLR
jgi:hypothetical protein